MKSLSASLRRLRKYQMMATLVIIMLLGAAACTQWISMSRSRLYEARMDILSEQELIPWKLQALAHDADSLLPAEWSAIVSEWVRSQELIQTGSAESGITEAPKGPARIAFSQLQSLVSSSVKVLRQQDISDSTQQAILDASLEELTAVYVPAIREIRMIWTQEHQRMNNWLAWAQGLLMVLVAGMILGEAVFITKPLLQYLYHQIKRREIFNLAAASHEEVIRNTSPRSDSPALGKPIHAQSKEDSRILAEQRPAKIMVVEDHPANQKYLQKLFQKLGYEITVASNGKEAVAKSLTSTFDLIFMDIQMPLMDGIEATYHILQKTDPANQPAIIALTGSAEPDIQEQCMDVGMKGIIWKPVKRSQIAEAIIKWSDKVVA